MALKRRVQARWAAGPLALFAAAAATASHAAVTIEFRNSSGHWFNADANAAVAGNQSPSALDYDNGLAGGNANVWWGNSTGQGKSGYKFETMTPDLPVGGPTGVTLGPPDAAGPFKLGKFKHVNRPITGTFLDTIDFRYTTSIYVDGSFFETRQFMWEFDHHETTNNQNPCPYGSPSTPGASGINRYGCADRIDVAFVSQNNTFVFDGYTYTFGLEGFLVQDGLNWVQREVFLTKEQQTSTAYILGSLSRQALPPPPGVPEPGTWALMILGFGGAGAMLRRGHRRYRLVERLGEGAPRSEEFFAPNDDVALARARSVAEGAVEVWRGKQLIAG